MSGCPQPERKGHTQILLSAFFSKLGFIFFNCGGLAEESKHPLAKHRLNLSRKPVVDLLFVCNSLILNVICLEL